MLLLELAVQGVRGCSASARAALKPGYMLIKGPQQPVPPLASLLTSIFYPDARGGDAAFLAPGLKTGRAGASLQGTNGVTLRIVRELGGTGALHRLNPATKAFEVVTQDASEIISTLRAEASLPTKSAFELLYTLTPGQFPSKRPRRAVSKKAESVSSAREFEDLSPEVVKDYEARIPVLEHELVDARRIAELQFKQDGMQSELYAAEQLVRGHTDAKDRLKAARAELAAAPTPEKLGLPADVLQQMERHEQDVRKRTEALRKLADEREGEAPLDSAPVPAVPALTQDVNFLGAMVAGMVLTAAGLFLEGSARYVSMLALLPWSFGAMRALAWIEELQLVSKESGRFERHSFREKKLSDELAMTKAQIKAALAAAQVDSMEGLVAMLTRRDQAQAALTQAEGELTTFEADPDHASAIAKVGGLRTELEKIQGQFQTAAGGYFRSPGEIEKELSRAKDAIRKAKSGGGAAPSAVAPAVEPGQGTLEDPGPQLLAAAAELLGSEVAKVAAEFKDRCSQYLTALSDKKWQSVEITPDGRAILVGASGRTNLPDASGKDADLYYLSLRLAVVEKVGPKHKLPLVIEDCFAEVVDPARFVLLNRMLKHLGSVSQVLHVSGAGQNAFQADALVNV